MRHGVYIGWNFLTLTFDHFDVYKMSSLREVHKIKSNVFVNTNSVNESVEFQVCETSINYYSITRNMWNHTLFADTVVFTASEIDLWFNMAHITRISQTSIAPLSPRDASCLLVLSFNSTERRAQSSIISRTSASDLPLCAKFIKFSSLLFGVFIDARRSVP